MRVDRRAGEGVRERSKDPAGRFNGRAGKHNSTREGQVRPSQGKRGLENGGGGMGFFIVTPTLVQSLGSTTYGLLLYIYSNAHDVRLVMASLQRRVCS